jgi:hypothetical protein
LEHLKQFVFVFVGIWQLFEFLVHCQIVEFKAYEEASKVHTLQTISSFKQKAQTTYEPMLTNTSTFGRNEPLKLAIIAHMTSKINPRLACIYNFKKTCKDKPRKLDCGKWAKHVRIMDS